MLDRAIQFLVIMAIRVGFAIIPIRPDKRPAIPGWKEFQLIRPSLALIELWMQDQPPAWAIITGSVSGVVVLDFEYDDSNATGRRRSRPERREFVRQINQGGRHAE